MSWLLAKRDIKTRFDKSIIIDESTLKDMTIEELEALQEKLSNEADFYEYHTDLEGHAYAR